ncbi:MAG TPA: TlpA disulfide reductase family protein [Planctomycetota bacterium]|nr:TlpA disulfide reductase family protein [Planctomycetota bacterium]
MRRSVLCVALLATIALAQNTKPGAKTAPAAPASYASLVELNAAFDKVEEEARKKVMADRLAAVEAFAGKASGKDALEARLQASELASELERHEAARTHAEKVIAECKTDEFAALKLRAHARAGDAAAKLGAPAETVVALLTPVIDGLNMKNRDSVFAAINATETLATYYADRGEKDAAIKAWTELGDKSPQLQQLVGQNVDGLKMLGETPKAFPESAKDTTGASVSLDQYKGKVLLIDFWATWCPPCMAEVPHVVAAYAKYKDRGFEVLGITLDNEETLPKMDEVMKAKGMTWRQIVNGKEADLAELYGVESIPTTYLVDQEGKIRRMNLRGKALEQALEKLLPAKAADAAPAPAKPKK